MILGQKLRLAHVHAGVVEDCCFGFRVMLPHEESRKNTETISHESNTTPVVLVLIGVPVITRCPNHALTIA